MVGSNKIRVPRNVYNNAIRVQATFLSKGKRIPLWKCLKIEDTNTNVDDILRRLRL
jgi:hypothetical protein